MNTKKLADSLQKVLGSAENEDFFDVTSAEDSKKEEVEEITEDEVNDAMDEESNGGDDVSVDVEEESNDDSDDVETEIKIEEGDDVEEITDDEVNEVMDEESNNDVDDSDDDTDDDSDDVSVVDDESDDDGDFSSDEPEEVDEEDLVEVNDVEEVDNDDYTDGEEDVVEVNDVELVDDNGDSLDGINDDDIDEAAEEYDNDDIQDNDTDDVVDDMVDDDVSNESEEMEEITDEDLIESGEVEEITDEDVENETDSSADNVSVDDEANASASELLASHGYQFETDACGRICIQGHDGECSNVEVVEDFPDDVEISQNDVNLALHESASEDPFYSVLIKGKPVAEIHLNDQEGEDKRNFFISQDYPKALTEAMVKGGVNKVLNAQNARRYVASVKASALAEEMKQKAKEEMREEIQASVVEMKDKFIECVKLAIAGMNKNFFNNKNDFKGAVYNAFANFGASNEVAVKETNKVFASAEPFFDAVVEKAQELMGFDENSFKTIASAVSDSGIGNVEVETFESKLMKGNNPIVASFAKTEEVTASAPTKRLTFKKHIG